MNNAEKLTTFGTQNRRRKRKKEIPQHNMYWTSLYSSKHK